MSFVRCVCVCVPTNNLQQQVGVGVAKNKEAADSNTEQGSTPQPGTGLQQLRLGRVVHRTCCGHAISQASNTTKVGKPRIRDDPV